MNENDVPNGQGVDADIDDGSGDGAPSFLSAERAPTVLRAGAVLAFVLWLITLVSSSVYWWNMAGTSAMSRFNPDTSLDVEPTRLAGVVAQSLSSTWGYLLVAVLAFAIAALVDTRRTTP